MNPHESLRRLRFAGRMLLVAMVLAFDCQPMIAGSVYGFGPSGIYRVDSATGATARVNDNQLVTFGASRSAASVVFYITTGLNLWSQTFTGLAVPQTALWNGATDLAFSPTAGLFGIDALGVYRIDLSVVQQVPTDPVATPGPLIEGITFGPGDRIYGVSNDDGQLWQIDPISGLSAPIGGPNLHGFSVMDLAYDPESRAFIASAFLGPVPGRPVQKIQFPPWDPLPPWGSAILRIDAATGFTTVLNDNAPVLYGMAENIPEPSTFLLLLPGLVLVLRRDFRRSRQTRRGSMN
ncbi:MAG: hypothetical protein FJW40_24755 [Acidobacteria bacterium]|nr:hypothetical protein [Acidobacteriota bacterium]